MNEPRDPTIESAFEDPLEHYEPEAYDDPVERALMEEPVSAICSNPVATVSPDTTVVEAMEKLAALDVACLLVTERDRLVGIFTERDVLDKVVGHLEETMDQPVRKVMTSDPIYVLESDPAAKALCIMALTGYRHVPIVDTDEKVVGIVSPLRVTGFLGDHFEL